MRLTRNAEGEEQTMERVYTTQDLAMLSHLKNSLAAQGIECVLRGQHLLGGVGELPPIECWPELWVLDDKQVAAAKSHINTLFATAAKDRSTVDLRRVRRRVPGSVYGLLELWGG